MALEKEIVHINNETSWEKQKPKKDRITIKICQIKLQGEGMDNVQETKTFKGN